MLDPVKDDVVKEVDDNDKENNVIGSIVTVTSSSRPPQIHTSKSSPLPSTVTTTHSIKEDTMTKLWNAKKSSRVSNYNNHIVNDMEILSCYANNNNNNNLLESFYKHYLSNNAKHSFEKYLLSKGDANIEISPWKQQQDNDNDNNNNIVTTSSRTINYLHPVHVPMAPPSAKATKEQKMQIFSTHGICIETITKVNDVPLTDCFHVEDIIFIEFVSDKRNKLKINASFQINFIKHTMWKSIIQLNTHNAFKQFLIGYANMIQKYQQQENNNNNAMFSLKCVNDDNADATNGTRTTSCSSSTRSSNDDYNDIDNSTATTFEQQQSYKQFSSKRRNKNKRKNDNKTTDNDRTLLVILFIFLSMLLIGMQIIFFMHVKEEMQMMKRVINN